MEPKNHKHLPVFTLGAIIFVGLIVFFSYRHYQTVNNESLIKVRLKWVHSAQFAGMYLAEYNGLYSRAGFNVQFEATPSPARSAVDLIQQENNAFAIMSSMELLDAVANGEKIKAVTAIYQETPSVIGSLAETKITSPDGLRGKTLGKTRSENFSFAFYNFLFQKYQIPGNTVSYKDVGFDAFKSVLDKKVDAASFYRTDAYFQKNSATVELNYIKPEDHGLHLYNDLIVTSTKLIKEKPELVNAFVAATLQGWQEALDNPAAGVKATQLYAKDKYSDPDFAQFMINTSRPLILTNGSKGIGQMTAEDWQEMYQIYKSTVVSTDFDVTKAYTLDFLP